MKACCVGQPGTDALGRSETFALCSLRRPWFRGFHASWLSFFLAFVGWFALVPAMQYLVESEENDIDDQARKLSDVLSVLGTVLIRLVFGEVVERWGPRRPQTVLLGYGAVLVLASSQINSATSLYVTRFLISLVGAAFIPCQFWTTMLFSEKVVGRANAFAGGWGNLGGGLTILFMANLIAQFRTVYDDEVAWRYAMIVPGILMLVACIPLWLFTDDCPQGLWEKRVYGRELQAREKPSDLRPKRGWALLEWTAPYCDWRVWILFIQYACCFGVELTFNNAMTSYLYQSFTIDEVVGEVDCTATGSHNSTTGQFFPECSILGKDTSAMVASLFGLQNLYARALGGVASDFAFKRYSLRGRLVVQFVVLFLEGIAIIVFSQLKSLPSAILCMVLLSILVQMAEGSTYSLTPFVRSNIGTVIGIVGAGGNIGAVSWATLLRYVEESNRAFLLIGIAVVSSSFLTLALNLQGQSIIYSLKKGDTQSVYGDEASKDSDSSASFTTRDTNPIPGSLVRT